MKNTGKFYFSDIMCIHIKNNLKSFCVYVYTYNLSGKADISSNCGIFMKLLEICVYT